NTGIRQRLINFARKVSNVMDELFKWKMALLFLLAGYSLLFSTDKYINKGNKLCMHLFFWC
ncbi:hypothetical protein NL393_38740, partial [Klebsiella pneumoniae]|nr:hypothetical protein [Klebsiella pneumoniae]